MFSKETTARSLQSTLEASNSHHTEPNPALTCAMQHTGKPVTRKTSIITTERFTPINESTSLINSTNWREKITPHTGKPCLSHSLTNFLTFFYDVSSLVIQIYFTFFSLEEKVTIRKKKKLWKTNSFLGCYKLDNRRNLTFFNHLWAISITWFSSSFHVSQ